MPADYVYRVVDARRMTPKLDGALDRLGPTDCLGAYHVPYHPAHLFLAFDRAYARPYSGDVWVRLDVDAPELFVTETNEPSDNSHPGTWPRWAVAVRGRPYVLCARWPCLAPLPVALAQPVTDYRGTWMIRRTR